MLFRLLYSRIMRMMLTEAQPDTESSSLTTKAWQTGLMSLQRLVAVGIDSKAETVASCAAWDVVWV
jgi:hypothetical protein